MSDKVYDVPAEWAKRAWVDQAKYQEMYTRSLNDPDGFWGEHGKRIDWFKPYTKVKDTSFDMHNVSIKWFEDGVTNVAYNCIDRHLPKRANQTAIIWEGDNPSRVPPHHLRRTRRRGEPLRQRSAFSWRQEGRPRHHLPADDPRDGLRDARLRASRRDPLGGVRRLLFRRARRPYRRTRKSESRHHRGRGPARRAQGAAESQCRRRCPKGGRREARAGRQTHGRRDRLDAGPRRVAARGGRARLDQVPGRAGQRGRPAVHPLYVGLDRRAEGRRPHHRRLSRLYGDDASVRVRLPRGRHLLVHGRRRLGDGSLATSSTGRSPTARRP